jgi:hypothetical protein
LFRTNQGVKMKRIVLVLTAVAAFAAISTTSAEAGGRTCLFRSSAITVKVSGSQNSPELCRIFGRNYGKPVSSYSGRAFCAWRMRSLNIVVTAFSHSSVQGRIFCSLVAPKMSSRDWRRIF